MLPRKKVMRMMRSCLVPEKRASRLCLEQGIGPVNRQEGRILQHGRSLAQTLPFHEYRARKTSYVCRLSTGTSTTLLASLWTLCMNSSDDGLEACQDKTIEAVNTLLQHLTVRFTIHLTSNRIRETTAMEMHWVRRLGRRRASTRWRHEERVETEHDFTLLLGICILGYCGCQRKDLAYSLLSTYIKLDSPRMT